LKLSGVLLEFLSKPVELFLPFGRDSLLLCSVLRAACASHQIYSERWHCGAAFNVAG